MCLRMKAHKSLRCSLLCGWLLLSLHLLSYAQQTELQIYGLVSSNATTPTEAYSPRKVQQLSMRNMQRGKPLQINLVYKDDAPMKMGYKEVLEHAAKMWGDNLTVSEQTRGLQLAGCIGDENGCLLEIEVTPEGNWYTLPIEYVQIGQAYLYDGKIVKTSLSESIEVNDLATYALTPIHKLCPYEFDDILVTLYVHKKDAVIASSPLSLRKLFTSNSSPTSKGSSFTMTLTSSSALQITFQDLEEHQIRLHSLSGELLISEEALGCTTLTLPTTLDIAHYILQVDNKTFKL